MRCLVRIFLILNFPISLYAQFTGHYNALNIAGTTNTWKNEIPLAQPEIVGSTYLDENWQEAEIVLKRGDTISDFQVKVEIEQANVEIQYEGEIKFINLKGIECIRLIDGVSGNKVSLKEAKLFSYNSVPLPGIVLVQGTDDTYNIIRNYYIEFIKSNYNIAMDVGFKDHRKVKKERVFISQASTLILVKGSSKKIAAQFGLDREKAMTIIKKHKFKLADEKDLQAFVALMQS